MLDTIDVCDACMEWVEEEWDKAKTHWLIEAARERIDMPSAVWSIETLMADTMMQWGADVGLHPCDEVETEGEIKCACGCRWVSQSEGPN
jgi:hypothetical protein